MPKCPAGRTRCGINCCPERARSASTRVVGRCSPCDIGQKPCGRKCCQRGSTCCDPETGLCCKNSETCAGYGGSAKCCPKGTKACETSSRSGKPICCKRGRDLRAGRRRVRHGARRGTGASTPVVRATARWRSASGVAVCCPAGYRSLGGRFILPPGGGGGLCCRKDKLCGNTCCGTNSDPAIDSDLLQRQVRLALFRLRELRRVRQTLRSRHRVPRGPLRDGVASRVAARVRRSRRR